MKLFKQLSSHSLLLLLCSLWVSAALADEDDVLVRKNDSVITNAMFDARIQQIPAKDRLAFVRDGGQVERMLGNLLLIRQIADEARKNGFDQDPVIQLQMQMAADQKLADSWVARWLEQAPVPDYEQLAMEYYTVNQERFWSEATIDISHILIKAEERTDEEAQALAMDVLDRLKNDPGQFEQLVMEHSEDSSAAANKGLFKSVKRGTMVPSFETVAFQMREPGELSEPVKTPYGYHIIRLEKINPSEAMSFEQAKPQLIQQQTVNHEGRVRTEFMNKFSTVELEIPPLAIEKMLQRYFGEDLENAPDYSGAIPQK